jgi:hypothetical protein
MTAMLLALAAPASAGAEVLTLRYHGSLASTNEPGLNDLSLVVTVVYDSDATPAGSGRFPVISAQVTLEDEPVTPVGPAFLLFESPSADEFWFTAELSGSFFGIALGKTDIMLRGPGTVLSGGLPTSQEMIDALSDRRMLLVTTASTSAETSLVRTTLTADESPEVVACDGFFEPFDAAIRLPRRSNRVIPLTMSLFDDQENELGPDDITAPTVSVAKTNSSGGEDLEELVDSAGRATSGNSFVWDEIAGLWAFNLATKPYSSAGAYTVRVAAGDDSYEISPTCAGIFVRQ